MRMRAYRRAMALGWALAMCLFSFGFARLHGRFTMERRAHWVQGCCRRVIAGLGIRYRVQGCPPTRGLLVSNHLSYLDIIIYGALQPCFFVAKAEIDRWPYFGMMARAGGTLFIDRSSWASAETVTDQITERIRGAVPVLFFPEGTSTDGSQLLRFHSRFFGPAAVAGMPVTAAAIRYVIEDGTPEQELCWFGDAAFLPHLWKALGTAGFVAKVHFGEPHVYSDRRTAAAATRTEIAAMRGANELVHS